MSMSVAGAGASVSPLSEDRVSAAPDWRDGRGEVQFGTEESVLLGKMNNLGGIDVALASGGVSLRNLSSTLRRSLSCSSVRRSRSSAC